MACIWSAMKDVVFSVSIQKDNKWIWKKSFIRIVFYVIHWNMGRCLLRICGRRVWRYQRGNQNPYIEEEQTTQWSKEKVQKDKQLSTKHTYKTKDRVTRTSTKNYVLWKTNTGKCIIHLLLWTVKYVCLN